MRRTVHTSRSLLLAALWLWAATACSEAPSYETQRRQAARRLSSTIDEEGLRSVAVVDFTSLNTQLDNLGRFLAVDLGTELKQEGSRFTLCDRDSLEQVLAELKLGTTGLVDEGQVAKVGKGCGAAGIIYGRHSRLDGKVVVNLRLLDVESQEVLATARMRFPDSPDFEELRRREVPLPRTDGRNGHSTAPARNLPQTSRLGTVKVTLESCTFMQYQLVCDLQVTNPTGESVALEVLRTTHLVDNQNDDYLPSEVWLDKRSRTMAPKLSSTLGARQTVPMQVEFESVPRSKKKAQLLQVDLGGAGSARFLDFAFDRDER